MDGRGGDKTGEGALSPQRARCSRRCPRKHVHTLALPRTPGSHHRGDAGAWKGDVIGQHAEGMDQRQPREFRVVFDGTEAHGTGSSEHPIGRFNPVRNACDFNGWLAASGT